eukprot:9475711-Pyramimonas_sp.AAC.1
MVGVDVESNAIGSAWGSVSDEDSAPHPPPLNITLLSPPSREKPPSLPHSPFGPFPQAADISDQIEPADQQIKEVQPIESTLAEPIDGPTEEDTVPGDPPPVEQAKKARVTE